MGSNFNGHSQCGFVSFAHTQKYVGNVCGFLRDLVVIVENFLRAAVDEDNIMAINFHHQLPPSTRSPTRSVTSGA